MLTIVGGGEPSLYLHIPFCTTCCNYCAFYSEPTKANAAYIERYVQRLEQEIMVSAASVDRFATLFIGGGNPGSLSVDQLRRLLVAAKADRCDEVTIEMNPETFTEEFFSLFTAGLITRLSMGIQSMNDDLLKRLGRNAKREDNLRAITLAQKLHENCKTDISFDLMVCLPGQSVDMAVADITELLRLSDMEHLSLYCLTVEEGTELAAQIGAGTTTVLDEDGQQEFLSRIWDVLKSLGFVHYEVSNFCRNNKTCKHNQVYWRLGNYLGLGSSAASTITDAHGGRHYTQTQTLREYAVSPCFSGYEEEVVDTAQQIEEFVMMALRTHTGIDKHLFFERYSKNFDSLFAPAVSTFDSSWYFDTEQFFIVSENGFMVLDEILLRLVLEIS